MNKVVKWIAILLGSLVLGGFIGWCFNLAGYSTAVAVAIVLVCFSAGDSIIKKVKK